MRFKIDKVPIWKISPDERLEVEYEIHIDVEFTPAELRDLSASRPALANKIVNFITEKL